MVVPTVMAHAVAVYVFYERHWESVSRNMAYALNGEIAYIRQHIEKSPDNFQEIANSAKANLGLQLLQPSDNNKFSVKSLRPQKGYDFFRKATSQADLNLQGVYKRDGYSKLRIIFNDIAGKQLMVKVSPKRLGSQTTYIFVFWLIGASLLFIMVATIFLRNQVRPIVKLAKATEMFGRGQEIADFRPSGAREVRQAATAFLMMSRRIRRQIEQRTEMLSGISHDLRTPITRMKLQLAMLPESVEQKNLKADVNDMERMTDEYLQFARGAEREDLITVHLHNYLSDIIKRYNRQHKNISLGEFAKDIQGDILLQIRPNAFHRAVCNLLDNAAKHGNKVEVGATQGTYAVRIFIDDNGSGIPKQERNNVFKAFYRVDKSRNQDKGAGVGLGLTIARDIISAHGGQIELADSPMGGLRVVIRMPLPVS